MTLSILFLVLWIGVFFFFRAKQLSKWQAIFGGLVVAAVVTVMLLMLLALFIV